MVGERAGGREVGVDRLTGDQQLHDLRRPLEDPVDPQVAHDLLGGHRTLTAGGQRVGGLVAPATADLDQLVGHLVRHLAGPQLRERSLDPDVLGARVVEPRRQVEHGLERERRGRDERELGRDRLVLADRLAPLDARRRPLPGDLEAPLAGSAHSAGIDSRPALSVVRAILRPWPSLPSRFSTGTRTLWKRVTPFSRPLRPMNALRCSTVTPSESRVHDEGGDAAAAAVGLGHRRHDDDQLGDDAVGGPQLHAVEQVGRHRRRVGVADDAMPRRVGPDVGLGEQEGGDGPGGAARQELAASAPRCRTSSPAPVPRWTGAPTSSRPSVGCTEPASIRARP